MDLKLEYEKLYLHWFQELQELKLTLLSQESFSKYRELISFIDNYNNKNNNELEYIIFKEYQKNLRFLFNDVIWL